MNLSLHKLKRIINKSAQGSMLVLVLATMVGGIVISSATQWYLQMNQNINVSTDKLNAMTLAYDAWNKIIPQSYEELASKTGKTEEEKAGDLRIVKEYGNTGVYNDSTGKCESGSPSSDSPRSCMNIALKVFDKDGKQIFTSNPTYVSSHMGNSYVKNGSFPEHQLGLHFNAEKNYIYGSVDGANTVFQPAVPDWRLNKQLYFSHVGDNIASFRYVVPQNGYFMVMNCATNIDFAIMVNGSFAYHKCSYSTAGMGYIPVAKEDVITVSLCSINTVGGLPTWGTNFFFIPTKNQ